MAVETIKIIDFGKALEFFESAFDCLDQKEVDATSVKLTRLAVQRLSYTSAQINETCLVLLAQIEALETRRETEGESRRQAEALIFQPGLYQAPARRDTERDLNTEALASGTNEEIEPYREKDRLTPCEAIQKAIAENAKASQRAEQQGQSQELFEAAAEAFSRKKS